ncbi:hypothetical protein P153DRAFT_356282 [Dothidotthia symphoricarpi CBS 119687]|uniref:Uncharacterized protein n=1 Tax=Dothidotthia symphoricarpi CBS 119687 TaxID=1392245 RepID=A0A6A6AH13_9PLEO|nr:uncharacterized protein P153DRAFT_356282 [Dothidotthia symphoricarpi CBS 119687]KAF2130533.1 hypothetical protein P153DRAFT_356282 [Dothidotthia symphoricarpi CBS 119687]
MSFRNINPDLNIPGAPEYPDTLSPTELANTTVHPPRELDPEYTTDPFDVLPPSFPATKELPDPLVHPALYAAAADVIRLTNYYLWAHGPYSVPPKEEWVIQEALKFPGRFPLPPDPRTLYVKEGGGDPTGDGKKLWTKACRVVKKMGVEEKKRFLKTTRQQHLDVHNSGYKDTIAHFEKHMMRFFCRYLVWREHVNSNHDDEQPSRQEMEEFWTRHESGASLAEICHAFPNARDMHMLVYRIERFAVYTPKPAVDGDPTESLYMRKRVPSRFEIQEDIQDHLEIVGAATLPQLLQEVYPNGIGNEQIVADVLFATTVLSPVVGSFYLAANPSPTPREVRSRLCEIDGRTLDSLVDAFANRIHNPGDFLALLSSVGYEDDGLWYARTVSDGEIESQAESLATRNYARLLFMLGKNEVAVAGLLAEIADWDSASGRYVRRPEIVPPSPTEVDEEVYMRAPPQTLSIDIFPGEETAPFVPLGPTGVDGTTQTEHAPPVTPSIAPPTAPPVAPPVAPPIVPEDEVPPPEDPEPAPAPTEKRKRTEEDQPGPSTKKPKPREETPSDDDLLSSEEEDEETAAYFETHFGLRPGTSTTGGTGNTGKKGTDKAPGKKSKPTRSTRRTRAGDDTELVQCGGTTKKNARCQLKKNLPVGEAYLCKTHSDAA